MQHLIEFDQHLRIIRFSGLRRRRRGRRADVSQRAEAIENTRSFFARRARRSQVERAQRVKKNGRPFGRDRCHIALLVRVRGQRVHFGNWEVDIFVHPRDHASQRRPSPSQVCGHGFEVRRPLVVGLSRDHATQRATGEIGVWQHAQGLEHRRHDVDVSNRSVERDTTRRVCIAGNHLRDEQGNPQRGLVRKDAVRELAVFAETLAVIGSDDDERGARLCIERGEQRSQCGIGPRHFSDVRRIGVARGVFGWRLIGRVGIEDMHPGQPL